MPLWNHKCGWLTQRHYYISAAKPESVTDFFRIIQKNFENPCFWCSNRRKSKGIVDLNSLAAA